MASDPDTMGPCPAPFLHEGAFPSSGGYVPGRYCEDTPTPEGMTSCCLPCPVADWKFTHDYRTGAQVANWLAVVVFAMNGLLLISYAVLPPKVTHRHYLNVCLTIGIMLMALSFIVSLGAQPQECYNDITPHDMKSDITCAFTGALIVFGGWTVVVWSFCRTLSLHLQVCWDVVPGQKFFYVTLSGGWIFPVAMLAIALPLSGTSYRFGSICHINHDYGLEVFWGPLIGVTGASLVTHFLTLCYCIHIYLRSVMDNSPTTGATGSRPAYANSARTLTGRQAYRRVRRVLQLQWRGFGVVITILANVIFFAIVFLTLDKNARQTPENYVKYAEWLFCLTETKGDRNGCAEESRSIGPSEGATVAVLILLAVSGLWTLLFFGHLSIVHGWVDLFRRKVSHRNEFVSADARDEGTQSRGGYEMYGAKPTKSPEPLLSKSPDLESSLYNGQYSPPKEMDRSYQPREASYTSPVLSFSSPRPPRQSRQPSWGRDWDPQATFAPGDGGRDLYRTHHPSHSRGFS